MSRHSLLKTLLKQDRLPGTERERAVAIHDAVRDRVRFGFTRDFDFASPEQTLQTHGRGHCNPSATLFVAALKEAGIEARLHLVTIDNTILDGLFPRGLPALLSHAFSEVKLGGRWVRVDSYIVDPALAAGAKRRLTEESRVMGYGVHSGGVSHWDGRNDAFSQLIDEAMALEDHGPWDSMASFSQSRAYRHRMGPVKLATVMRWAPRKSVERKLDSVNARLDATRAYGTAIRQQEVA